MTQLPWFDQLWRKNVVGDVVQQFLGHVASTKLLEFAARAFQDRKAGVAEHDKKALSETHGVEDFLGRFIRLQEASPEIPPW